MGKTTSEKVSLSATLNRDFNTIGTISRVYKTSLQCTK
jgi:hypothetical protein